MISRTISVAPMMDWTDRHCRYFHRLLSQHVLLYTEMVTTGALLFGETKRFLRYHDTEHPIALQLGGSDPKALARCAQLAQDAGFDEVNLNVGCPSDRVQSGQFGLCLMKNPALVAECVSAMKAAVSMPITIKTRIGVDDQDDLAHLEDFVAKQLEANVDHICIHARKGWLKGLSPKENRNIPPLQYEHVYTIKQRFPKTSIGINGGITSLTEAHTHLQHVDTVMIGRAAYQNPYILAKVDQQFYENTAPKRSRLEIVEALKPYIQSELKQGQPLNRITRHILGLFQGKPGAKRWRQVISQQAHLSNAGLNVIDNAINATLAAGYQD